MKISNSKKQLANIISENGGWREGAESATQCNRGEISFWRNTAKKRIGEDWCGSYLGCEHDIEFTGGKIPNWHQTILSRDEYFHLYPAPDADGWIEWKGGECPVEDCDARIDVKLGNGSVHFGTDIYWEWDSHSLPITAYRLHKQEINNLSQVGDTDVVELKTTIESLAADYKAKLAIAQQAQEEADSHRCGAEAAFEKLYQAGLLIGLDIAIAHDEPEEQEDKQLNITDWRDLRVGDEVECVSPNIRKDYYTGRVGVIVEMDGSHTPLLVQFDGRERIWCHEVKFIRRP